MKRIRPRSSFFTALAVSVTFIAGCASPADRGWHRPAKPGERVGQVMEVKGTSVTVSIDESCLVHTGDVLSVQRLYCEPGAQRTGTRGCRLVESGTITVEDVNAADHTAAGKIVEGSAAADAPVFMTDRSLADRFPKP